VVIAAFAISNSLQEEAGLLEATLLGIIMANQPYVSVRRIVEFKEDLRVLLISLLFIVLSARLEPSAFEIMLAPGPLWFLAALMLLVRPLAVVLSSLGTGLDWREQAFLSWLAPRGIVAAAVASLFSFRLAEFFPAEAERIVPVVFLVIVGMVSVYGRTISPLARWLGLAQPDPQGVLFVGAQGWVRRVAQALQELGVRVLLIDANARNVRLAKRAGLDAQRANILAEGVIDDLELSGVGRLLAVTPNDEVNALAALHFGEVFESEEVYQLPMRADGPKSPATEIPRHLRGRPLFATDATFTALDERLNAGAGVHVVRLTEERTLAALLDEADTAEQLVTPLFLVRGEKVRVYAEDADIVPLPGDALVVLADRAPADVWTEMEEVADDGLGKPLPPDTGDGLPGEPARPEAS